MKIQTFKTDEQAEFHPLKNCRTSNPGELFCMVCGEVIEETKFDAWSTRDCSDCGIHLAVFDGCLVHFTSESNRRAPNEFYTRVNK